MLSIESLIPNEDIRFLVIFISTIVLVIISRFILKRFIKIISGKKKKYEEYVLKQLSKPFYALIFFIGTYIALRSFTYSFYDQTLIDGIFFSIVVLVSALFVSRIITVLMIGWLKLKRGFERAPQLINKIITIIIFVFALIIIIDYFQYDITPLIAGVGLGALAIGLALQSTLANFFAGVHLLSDRPINVGDFIELDADTSGYVEDIGWRSTRIRMLTDNLLIIPNGKLAESNIINYSMPKQDVSIWIPCGVSYESDLKKVEKVTLEVAKEIQQNVDGAVKDFPPGFRYKEFGDSNINFITILQVTEPIKRFVVRHKFIKALKERFDKEGIEISWPIRKIYNMK